jgi:hypothetical protein
MTGKAVLSQYVQRLASQVVGSGVRQAQANPQNESREQFPIL